MCQQKLAEGGVVEALLPLLTSKVDSVAKSAWMAMNWVVYNYDGKQRFLRGGGAGLLMSSLSSPVSCGVVFCTRKLAHLPDTRATLLREGILDPLIKLNTESEGDRMQYVTALALSFLCIDKNPDNLDRIRNSGAIECILKTVQVIDIAQDLNILYTTLADNRTLITSDITEIQCFGLLWTLHLLTCQERDIYKRTRYREMVIEENLLQDMLQILSNTTDTSKSHLILLEYAISCVCFLAKHNSCKISIVKEGGLQIILKVADCFKDFQSLQLSERPPFKKHKTPELLQQKLDCYTLDKVQNRIAKKANLCLYHLTEDKDVYIWKTTDTLLQITELYVCNHLDDDNVFHILEFAEAYGLERLLLCALCYVVNQVTESGYPSAKFYVNQYWEQGIQTVSTAHQHYSLDEESELLCINVPSES